MLRIMPKICGHLQALPVLQAKFAIKRALMRMQIQVPKSCKAEALELLDKLEAEVETKDFSPSQVKLQPQSDKPSAVYPKMQIAVCALAQDSTVLALTPVLSIVSHYASHLCTTLHSFISSSFKLVAARDL